MQHVWGALALVNGAKRLKLSKECCSCEATAGAAAEPPETLERLLGGDWRESWSNSLLINWWARRLSQSAKLGFSADGSVPILNAKKASVMLICSDWNKKAAEKSNECTATLTPRTVEKTLLVQLWVAQDFSRAKVPCLKWSWISILGRLSKSCSKTIGIGNVLLWWHGWDIHWYKVRTYYNISYTVMMRVPVTYILQRRTGDLWQRLVRCPFDWCTR